MEKSENKMTTLSEQAMNVILKEHLALYNHFNFQELQAIVDPINKADAIFLIGMGRSGLMMEAAAMRLMHLGYKAYVVGQVTAPAIKMGDLLITGSGSGTTATVVRAAEKALEIGADVISFTTNGKSKLAGISTYLVTIPAAQKEQHENAISDQYAGSLFEQGLLLLFDALIQTLWKIDGSSAEKLYKRHSNLE